MAEEKCPHCGTPYEAEATFCINCGAKREEAAPPAEEEAAPKEPPAEEKAVDKTAAEKPTPEEPEAKPPPEEPSPPAEEKAAPPPAEKPTPPPEKPAPPADKPAPPPKKPAADEKVLERLDEELEETPQIEPKKKSKKGCCIAGAIAAGLLVIAVACTAGLYFTGTLEEWGITAGGAAYSHDFAAVTEADFDVWQKGPGALVKPENGMLKVSNALVGVNYDPGTNYTATCTVFVQSVEAATGWAGLALRVNPKGGDRYSFEIVPEKKLARIRKILAKGDPLVLASGSVSALAVGTPFDVTATAAGSELTMEINGTVVGQATDIGLLQGPMGFEVRHATAYFDDLTINPQ
ncbi:MAG: zinc ribbon domain-containing protein [Candidatus Coatesbacteria bacterium]|nr:MAG: zinc ribbon domain-containing protein [Candidatus Coatesbacteria bacterium]